MFQDNDPVQQRPRRWVNPRNVVGFQDAFRKGCPLVFENKIAECLEPKLSVVDEVNLDWRPFIECFM